MTGYGSEEFIYSGPLPAHGAQYPNPGIQYEVHVGLRQWRGGVWSLDVSLGVLGAGRSVADGVRGSSVTFARIGDPGAGSICDEEYPTERLVRAVSVGTSSRREGEA